MATLTIRNLDDDIKRRLRIEAAEHGRSMEEQARVLLAEALRKTTAKQSLGAAVRAIIDPLGGFDLPPRQKQPYRPEPFE